MKTNIINHLKYAVKNNEITILSCGRDISGDVEIPETIDGYPVTEIDAFAFSFCKNMTSAIIPKSVKQIGKCAFFFNSLPKGLFYSGTYEDWKKIKIGESAIDFNVEVYAISVDMKR